MAGLSNAFDQSRLMAYQEALQPSATPMTDAALAQQPFTSQVAPPGPSLYGPEAQAPVASQLNLAAAPQPSALEPPAAAPMSLQDWLALSYLTTALGGAVGQYFKKGIPPPPVGFQTTSPGPPTTPTATQAAMGLAQLRRSRQPGGFGRG